MIGFEKLVQSRACLVPGQRRAAVGGGADDVGVFVAVDRAANVFDLGLGAEVAQYAMRDGSRSNANMMVCS